MGAIGSILRGILAIALAGVVVAVGVFIFVAVSDAFKTVQVPEEREPVVFTVEPGQSSSEIADRLESEGVIDSAFLFKAKLKLRSDATLKAGKFQVTPGMDMDQLITVLSTAPAEIGLKFTIIEGQRIEEVGGKLSVQNVVSEATFLQLAATAEGAAKFQNDFLAQSGRPADAGLEGYLFPDTYEIKQGDGDNSEAVINVMLGNLVEKFTPEMRQAAADQGRSIHQVMTIASIVQREGVVKDELPMIAAVFWNRVDEGMTLGADPTTQYAVAEAPDWWPNLDTIGVVPGEVEHPYNTYVVAGLPPGPICSPGLDAIIASVYPAESPYLYFVAKGDGSGEHAFATTLDEHERNRILYGNR